MNKILVDLRTLPKVTNKKFYKLYKNKDRYLILYGGAGSGKSVFAVQKILFRILIEQNHRIAVFRKVGRTLRHSVFELFQNIMSSWNLTGLAKINKSEMTISFPAFNSEILFLGIDNPEKLKSIAGITSIWIEEATELTEDDLKQINLRLRGKTKNYKQIIMTFNPISELHWIKNSFFDNPRDNATIVKSTYLDNKFLDEEYIQEIERLKEQDEMYYKVYALGEWGVIGNLIYHNWDVVKELPDNYDERYYGLDFGFNNPTALVEIRVKDDEYYLKELIYQTKLTNQDLIGIMKSLGINYNDEVYCDSAEPQRIEELQRAGFNAYNSDKSVLDGIDFVKRKKLHITADSANLLAEIKMYKWAEKDDIPQDKPVKFKDHLMDAMRYAIYTHNLDIGGEVETTKFNIL